MVRVNEDSWAMYCVFLCDNAGGLQLAWRPRSTVGRGKM